MGKLVNVTHNPYTKELQVLIDNNETGSFSEIKKYNGELFIYWCDKILDVIYDECNQDDFELIFCSTELECEIMKDYADKYSHCTKFSAKEHIYNLPIEARLQKLSSYMIDNGFNFAFKNNVFQTVVKNILFVVDEEFLSICGELEEIDVRNCFCEYKPKVVYSREYDNEYKRDVTIFLLNDYNKVNKYSDEYNKKTFFIVKDKQNRFIEKKNMSLIYECNEDDIFNVIFNCLKIYPLIDMLDGGLDAMDLGNSKIAYVLKSVYPCPIPLIDSDIVEKDCCVKILFSTENGKGYINPDELRFEYDPEGVIECNGSYVKGLNPGKVNMSIYRKGEYTRCANIDLCVITRNRVTELVMAKNITVGLKDKFRLDVTYYPVDADNIENMKWETTDTNIVSIGKDGLMTATGLGEVYISCNVDNVIAKCCITVKNHLCDIMLGTNNLDMMYGEEQVIEVKGSPDNCVDGDLLIDSLDRAIISVSSNKVKAIGEGRTKLIVHNKENTVKKEITVTVHRKKKGLLSKLFGF